MAGPRFRPLTMDDGIWNEVASGRAYGACGPFSVADVVIDIGCHIGSFAAYALARGAGTVAAYEADAANAAIARENLRRWGDAVTVQVAAVGRSDRQLAPACFSGYPITSDGLVNTGGGKVHWDTRAGTIPALAFDRIVDDAAGPNRRRVRLVKLDCEGAEWPILFTSRRLHAVDEIVGEYHELAADDEHPARREAARTWNCTAPALRELLQRAGFEVQSSPPNPARLGSFTARRAARVGAHRNGGASLQRPASSSSKEATGCDDAPRDRRARRRIARAR